MNSPIAAAAALLCGASLAAPALAAVPLTTTVSVAGASVSSTTPTVSVSLPSKNSTTTRTATSETTTRSAPGVNLDRFDTATGILVGATVGVSDVGTYTGAQVSGLVKANGPDRTITSSVSMAGTISGTGFTDIVNTATISTRSCTRNSCPSIPGLSATNTPGPSLNATRVVDTSSLAAYAGAGTVTLDRSATGTATVTTGADAIGGTADGFYLFLYGTYSIAYDYLNFATPSLSGNAVVTSLNLDFGTVNRSRGPITRTFSLFNIGDGNSAGANLTSITRDTNDAYFSSSVSNFTNLGGGNSLSYNVTFDPSQLGAGADVFRLALADYAPGGIGGKTYALDIAVSGISVVPEPGSWATIILGLGFVGVTTRRRRTLALKASE